MSEFDNHGDLLRLQGQINNQVEAMSLVEAQSELERLQNAEGHYSAADQLMMQALQDKVGE